MNILPFRPLLFSTELQKSISPPYDIITKTEEHELKNYPFNITHITLPKNNAMGKERFDEWLANGILYRYPRDTIIVIVQKFEHNEKRLERYSLMAPVQTSPPSNDILTHENTFDKFVNERKDLMKRTRCQLEPIFLLSEGGDLLGELKKYVKSAQYQYSVEEPIGVTNDIYVVEDKTAIKRILASAADSKGVVADGHHRLRATRELYEEEGQDDNFWKFSLSYVAPADQDSLLVLGIHRVISKGHNLRDHMDKIGEYFEISEVSDAKNEDSVVLYDGKYYRITPKETAYRDALMNAAEDHYPSDPTLVDRVLIGKIFGIEEGSILTNVAYEGDLDEARRMVDSGDNSLAIIMPQWNKQQLFHILDNGIKLPRKSTYFFPKVPSGITLYN